MSDSPSPHRTRFAAAGILGASALAVLMLGAGPAPSAFQLAGASDDVPDDANGSCDEPEHAGDPECGGTPTPAGTTGAHDDDGTTSTTAGGGAIGPVDEVRSLDAAGAGTVIYAVEDGSLRLITATPASGWAVEVEHDTGLEVELDFRSDTQRVQVNVEIEDGQVRERVRLRDDAGDTDIRVENGVVVRDGSTDDDDNRGPGGADDDPDDDSSGSGHSEDDDSDDDSGDDDSPDDDSSGSGSDHPEDD